MKFRSEIFSLIIILLLSFFSIRYLFMPGFFPMHDDTQVARVFEMRDSLMSGMLPVRWVQDLGYGYGYPIFNFYAPLSYYVGGGIDLLVSDSLTSTKLMIALGILLSGITMYFLAKEFWGRLGAIISAVFYVYAPYHALNVYVRGAVAETYGYAFIPLVFYGFYKSYKEKEWKYVVLGSIGFAGLITSHNLTALIVTPFILLMLCILILSTNKINRSTILSVSLPFLLGLLLAAFYWIPSIFEMGYTNVASQIGGGADFIDHFVCLPQIWDSVWGFGGSVPGCIDGLSFRIGKIHLIFSVLALVAFYLKKSNLQKSVISFATFILLSSVFLMSNMSEHIWEALSPLKYIQYPWRFLLLSSASTSFLAGAVVWLLSTQSLVKLDRKIISAFACIALATSIFFYAKLFTPQVILDTTSAQLTSKEFLNWNVSKISDEYMPKSFDTPNLPSDTPAERFEVKNTNAQIIHDEAGLLKARIVSPNTQRVHINLAYFPSWVAYLNQQKVDLIPNSKGTSLTLVKGVNDIHIQFVETPIQKIANILTLSGFSVLILGIILSRKRKLINKV